MKIVERGWSDKIQVDSCGTSNYNIGDAPDDRTIHVAHQHHVPIQHIARQLTHQDIEEFDLILAMDHANVRAIERLASPHHRSRIKLIRSYDPQGEGEVPDPYYGSAKDFILVYEMLDRSIEGLLNHLKQSGAIS